ncbi:MAG: aminopeptidase [Polyangia bacterium]
MSRHRSRRMTARALLVLATLQSALQGGCFGVRYVAQQAGGQLQLLRSRRHVDEVLRDPATSPETRARLTLALEARRFGIEQLGLRGGAEFTRFVDPGGPVAYNLVAAEATRLRNLSWRFPFIGRVPYLGFFKRDDAVTTAKGLRQRGYDVDLRPVGAYSTLGYFISPIYASMLDDAGPDGEVRTVETILHEMAHSTVWLPGSDLNEGFASLVGVQGAARFFRERGDLAQSELAVTQAQEQEQRARAFSAWFAPALDKVRAFYKKAELERHPRERILKEREAVFAELMQSYRAAFPKGPRYKRLAEGPISNALLLSFGVYHGNDRIQEDLLASVDGDLRAFVGLYKQALGTGGTAWLKQLVADYRRTLPEPPARPAASDPGAPPAPAPPG